MRMRGGPTRTIFIPERSILTLDPLQESFLLRTRKFDKKVEETTHVWNPFSLYNMEKKKIVFSRPRFFKHIVPTERRNSLSEVVRTYLVSSRI
jgi:hypothetical protein